VTVDRFVVTILIWAAVPLAASITELIEEQKTFFFRFVRAATAERRSPRNPHFLQFVRKNKTPETRRIGRFRCSNCLASKQLSGGGY
jgi:hypothetical protein